MTLPAARRGIKVTGLDLAANLVQQAQSKAAAEGLEIRVDEGDAENLPYPDASFDVVMSLIGSMFAPRPELVASGDGSGLRPGGKIIMGNWTPGRSHRPDVQGDREARAAASVFPVAAPLGQRVDVPGAFRNGVSDLKITRYMYPFEYPFAPAKVVDFFIEYYGPTNRAYLSLDAAGQEGDARRPDRALDQKQRRDRRVDAGVG